MNSESGDRDIAQLLTRSGPRPEPSAAARQRIHDDLLEVWQTLPDETESRGSTQARDNVRPQDPKPATKTKPVWLAMAAAVSVASVGAWLGWSAWTLAPTPVAEIAYSTGGYAVTPSGDGSTLLTRGSTVRTSDEARILLALDAQTTVRLDHNTRATLRSTEEIYLHSGRLYVDSHGGSNKIRVTTERAAVSKVGTQFEVSLVDNELEVAVREGQVKVEVDRAETLARASNGVGEVLRYEGSGQPSKQIIATTDLERWQWTQLSRPDFDVGASTYHEYLSWAARERGLTLRYADEILELSAKNQTGAGRHDASDSDIDDALRVDGYYTRAQGKPHELFIVRP